MDGFRKIMRMEGKRRKARLNFVQPCSCIVDQWELPRNNTERLALRLEHDRQIGNLLAMVWFLGLNKPKRQWIECHEKPFDSPRLQCETPSSQNTNYS